MRAHSAVILLLFLNWKMGIKSDKTRELFASRTPADWRNVWHQERHRRCFHDLVGHMDWVCSNDIYKENKKSDFDSETDFQKPVRNTYNSMPPELQQLFLTREEAMSVLKTNVGYLQRKRKKRGIMDECCSDNGCSWEEYAEYCPTNRRVRTRFDGP